MRCWEPLNHDRNKHQHPVKAGAILKLKHTIPGISGRIGTIENTVWHNHLICRRVHLSMEARAGIGGSKVHIHTGGATLVKNAEQEKR
jgi:hypothetical protein